MINRFVIKIPSSLAPEQAAPLLCAGVTVYSPLKHFELTTAGLRGAIMGLGGVGHMGVKIAKAMGHHVTVISSSDRKRTEAMDHLGADAYLVSSDEAQMAAATDSFDYIIDTVPAFHPLEPYLSLLKLDGKLILMGVINQPLQFVSPAVMLGELILLDLNLTLRFVLFSLDFLRWLLFEAWTGSRGQRNRFNRLKQTRNCSCFGGRTAKVDKTVCRYSSTAAAVPSETC